MDDMIDIAIYERQMRVEAENEVQDLLDTLELSRVLTNMTLTEHMHKMETIMEIIHMTYEGQIHSGQALESIVKVIQIEMPN